MRKEKRESHDCAVGGVITGALGREEGALGARTDPVDRLATTPLAGCTDVVPGFRTGFLPGVRPAVRRRVFVAAAAALASLRARLAARFACLKAFRACL